MQEDRMELRKHFTSIALVGSLLVALATFGMAATAASAYADDSASTTATGSITINTNTNVTTDSTKLSGYQIFKADVADKTVGTVTTKAVSNIDWANDTVKSIVNEQIKAVDSSYTSTSAQEAANWLTEHASGSGSSTVVSSSDAFGKIAKSLRASSITATEVTPGTPVSLNTGYWLFVTTESTTSGIINQVGTSPIYAVVGGSAVTVDQKSSLPTVSKFIRNDATGSGWTKYADSQIGQNIEYKLSGTIADTYTSYDSYYYSFSDVLESGLTANLDSVTVKVQTPASGNTAQTETTVAASSYSKSIDSTTNTLKVTIDDLKKIKDENGKAISITPNSIVTVYYTASLNSKALVATKHNDNTVTLTYSNNPGTDSHGETAPDTVRDYTYELMLMKIDSSDNSKALSGAKFTIQATNPDEGEGTQYVQSDGSLGDTAQEFTTGSDGGIYISGLDAGTYTVVETQAPSGYNTAPSFTFTILPVYDTTTGDINKITASASDASMSSASVTDGVITVLVKDNPGMTLPLTGQNGVALLWLVGGAMIAAGIVYMIRSRRKDKAQQ